MARQTGVEDKKKIPLKFPFEAKTADGGTVTISEFTIRRMRVKDLNLMPAADESGKIKPMEFVPLIASLSGLSEEAVGEMDAEDLGSVAQVLKSFYPDSQAKTGSKSFGESPQPTDSTAETSGK